ncbi:hypothetical protein [Actinomadura graeca]|uniref:hypothetical protein n=1 Tax=Actinomadura graeca TaxID=2750812 RepID=UPI001E357520|nr:hypothetical protein [Actinomadura graeca]
MADVTGRPIWRLLLRGLGVYLPGWETPAGVRRVSDGGPAAVTAGGMETGLGGTANVPGGSPPQEHTGPGHTGPGHAGQGSAGEGHEARTHAFNGGAEGFGPPAFLNGDAGFGLQLPERRRGLEPDREIYVRGRENPSFGIVVAGPSAAIGTRVVDAAALMRFARRLTFEELFDTADADSVPYAVRGARAVENVVFLDRAAGIGLCAEVEPMTRFARCPVYVRIGGPAERTVRAYETATGSM